MAALRCRPNDRRGLTHDDDEAQTPWLRVTKIEQPQTAEIKSQRPLAAISAIENSERASIWGMMRRFMLEKCNDVDMAIRDKTIDLAK